jgi:hypothetical protein
MGFDRLKTKGVTMIKRLASVFYICAAVFLLAEKSLANEAAEIESLHGIASVWLHVMDDTGGLINQSEALSKVRRRLREQGLVLGGVSADAQLRIRFSSIVVGNQGGQFLYVFVVHTEVFQLANIVRLQANTKIPPRLASTWANTLFSFRIGDEAARAAILEATDTLLARFIADYQTANARSEEKP